jgi:hypothetical protein
MIRALQNLIGRPSAPVARRRPSARLAFDALEGRQLMTLYGASRVDSYRENPTSVLGSSANASARNGAMVAAWIDQYGDTSTDQGQTLIFAQAYNPNKTFNGSQIYVDDASGTSIDDSVRVAINDQGYIAIAWRNFNLLTQTSTVNVFVTDANGDYISRTTVGYQPGASDYMPDVAIDDNNHVGVSFVENANGSTHVYAQWLDIWGDTLSYSYAAYDSQGGDFVNTRIASSPDGSFALAYETNAQGFGGYWGLVVERYAGYDQASPIYATLVASEAAPFDSALSTNGQDHAAVAYVYTFGNGTSALFAAELDAAGNNYYQLTVDNNGNTLWHPAIALADSGWFVVAYNTTSLSGMPGVAGVNVMDFTQWGTTEYYGIYDQNGNSTYDPALSIDANGNYFLTYTDGTPGQDNTEIWDNMGYQPPPVYFNRHLGTENPAGLSSL